MPLLPFWTLIACSTENVTFYFIILTLYVSKEKQKLYVKVKGTQRHYNTAMLLFVLVLVIVQCAYVTLLRNF